MWLENTTTEQGCRDHQGRVAQALVRRLPPTDVEGIDWHGTDGYELRSRHAPDTPRRRRHIRAEPERVRDDGHRPGDAGFTAPTTTTTILPAATPRTSTASRPRAASPASSRSSPSRSATRAGDDSTRTAPRRQVDADDDQDPTELCLTVDARLPDRAATAGRHRRPDCRRLRPRAAAPRRRRTSTSASARANVDSAPASRASSGSSTSTGASIGGRRPTGRLSTRSTSASTA